MGLTKIDFHLLQAEQRVPYVALNPLRRPGSFVLAFALSPNSRIGAQLRFPHSRLRDEAH